MYETFSINQSFPQKHSWLSVREFYPVISLKAVKIFLPFASSWFF